MINSEIYIYRLEHVKWKNHKTGVYDVDMTKICYLIKMSNSNDVLGYSDFSCYKKGNLLEKLNPYLMTKDRLKADIENVPVENKETGAKTVRLVIKRINGREI